MNEECACSSGYLGATCETYQGDYNFFDESKKKTETEKDEK
mgnify:CR=1 FL=1